MILENYLDARSQHFFSCLFSLEYFSIACDFLSFYFWTLVVYSFDANLLFVISKFKSANENGDKYVRVHPGGFSLAKTSVKDSFLQLIPSINQIHRFIYIHLFHSSMRHAAFIKHFANDKIIQSKHIILFTLPTIY